MTDCSQCVLSKASLSSGGAYLRCFLHDAEKGDWDQNASNIKMSDLMFSFGSKGDFYFYSPRHRITST